MADHLGELCDYGTIQQSGRNRIAAFIVDDEEVAEWTMNDVEADIRAPLARVGVVLNQSAQEGAG